MELERLVAHIEADVSGLRSELATARAQIDAFTKTTGQQVNQLAGTFKAAEVAAKGMLAVFAGNALSGMIQNVVRANVTFQSLTASLKTVEGSADGAARAWKQIEQFAASTPYQVEDVTKAFIRLKSMGLDASMETLESYGNTASSMSKSLMQMIEAVADATTGEFERLKEFGIRASQEGDKVTFTFRGVSTTVGKSAKEIGDYLKKIGETQFAGAMTEQMKTLGGAFSNLQDAVASTYRAIGQSGFNDALIELAQTITKVVQGSDGLARALGQTLATATSALSTAIKFCADNATELALAFSAAMLALAPLTGAFTAFNLVLVGLGTAYITIKSMVENAGAAQRAYEEAQRASTAAAEAGTAAGDKNALTLQKEAKEANQAAAAHKELALARAQSHLSRIEDTGARRPDGTVDLMPGMATVAEAARAQIAKLKGEIAELELKALEAGVAVDQIGKPKGDDGLQNLANKLPEIAKSLGLVASGGTYVSEETAKFNGILQTLIGLLSASDEDLKKVGLSVQQLTNFIDAMNRKAEEPFQKIRDAAAEAANELFIFRRNGEAGLKTWRAYKEASEAFAKVAEKDPRYRADALPGETPEQTTKRVKALNDERDALARLILQRQRNEEAVTKGLAAGKAAVDIGKEVTAQLEKERIARELTGLALYEEQLRLEQTSDGKRKYNEAQIAALVASKALTEGLNRQREVEDELFRTQQQRGQARVDMTEAMDRETDENKRLAAALYESKDAYEAVRREIEITKRARELQGLGATADDARAAATAWVDAAEEVRKATEAANEFAKESERSWEPFKQAIANVQTAIAEGFYNVLNGEALSSVKSFAKNFLDIMLKVISQVAAAMVFKPVIGELLGAVGAPASLFKQFGLSVPSGTPTSGGFGLGSLNIGGIGVGDALSGAWNWLKTPMFNFGGSPTSGAALYGSEAVFGPGSVAPWGSGGANAGAAGAAGGFGVSPMDILGPIGSALPGLLSGNYVQAGLGAGGFVVGNLILPGVGGVVGGFLGNLVGSLFGKKPKNQAGEWSMNFDGTSGFQSATKAEIADLVNSFQAPVTKTIEQLESSFGVTRRADATVGAVYDQSKGSWLYYDQGARDGGIENRQEFAFNKDDKASIEAAIQQFAVAFMKDADWSGYGTEIGTFIGEHISKSTATTIEELMADVSWLASYEQALETFQSGSIDLTENLRLVNEELGKSDAAAMTKQIEDFRAKVEKFGLDTGESDAALRSMIETMAGLKDTTIVAGSGLTQLEQGTIRITSQWEGLRGAIASLGYTAEEVDNIIRSGITTGIANLGHQLNQLVAITSAQASAILTGRTYVPGSATELIGGVAGGNAMFQALGQGMSPNFFAEIDAALAQARSGTLTESTLAALQDNFALQASYGRFSQQELTGIAQALRAAFDSQRSNFPDVRDMPTNTSGAGFGGGGFGGGGSDGGGSNDSDDGARDAVRKTIDGLRDLADTIRDTERDARNLGNAWQRLYQTLRDARMANETNPEVSPQPLMDIYTQAEKDFFDAIATAASGTGEEAQDAASRLPELQQRFLELSKTLYGTTDKYVQDFNRSQNALKDIELKAFDISKAQLAVAEAQLDRLEGIEQQIEQLNGSLSSGGGSAPPSGGTGGGGGSTGGGSAPPSTRDWGAPANVAANKQLAAVTGYTGDFGGGRFDAWIKTQAPHIKAAAADVMFSNNTPERITWYHWGTPENGPDNVQLARVTGYRGDFGGGGFDAWIKTQPESVKEQARAVLRASGRFERITFHQGGLVGGDVNATLQRGEYVIPSRVVNQMGTGFFNNLREGRLPGQEGAADLRQAFLEASRREVVYLAEMRDMREAMSRRDAEIKMLVVSVDSLARQRNVYGGRG